jgi:2-polyprenyl-6-methoxyphenol hydroxylase-like FAD-dependent oxidoreductase
MPLGDSGADMSSGSVVILGSGIGGLTLGRCLRQKGISSVIYERTSSAPRHTYGITLESWAYRPLLKILDMDEHTFRRRIAVDGFYHGGIGKLNSNDPLNPDGTQSTSFRASRNKLESILREGQLINLEHSLSSARKLDDQSKVELAFQNDLKLTPTVIVDMMGVHSQLRKSLLPSVTLKVLPFVVFSSKRYLKSAHFQSTYASAFNEGNCITLEPKVLHDPRLEITINDHLPNGDVSISYIYSRAAMSDVGQDPLHDPDRPIAGATDIPEEFYEELEKWVEEHKPKQPFLDAFDSDQIQTERLLHWLMRTVLVPEEDLKKLLKYGVIMVGDSVHATPILGARGANFAISDAVELAGIIVESGADRETIERFYRERWPKWSSEVEDSEKRIAEMHAVTRASL